MSICTDRLKTISVVSYINIVSIAYSRKYWSREGRRQLALIVPGMRVSIDRPMTVFIYFIITICDYIFVITNINLIFFCLQQ